jgi:hypothetical protein
MIANARIGPEESDRMQPKKENPAQKYLALLLLSKNRNIEPAAQQTMPYSSAISIVEAALTIPNRS